MSDDIVELAPANRRGFLFIYFLECEGVTSKYALKPLLNVMFVATNRYHATALALSEILKPGFFELKLTFYMALTIVFVTMPNYISFYPIKQY